MGSFFLFKEDNMTTNEIIKNLIDQIEELEDAVETLKDRIAKLEEELNEKK